MDRKVLVSVPVEVVFELVPEHIPVLKWCCYHLNGDRLFGVRFSSAMHVDVAEFQLTREMGEAKVSWFEDEVQRTRNLLQSFGPEALAELERAQRWAEQVVALSLGGDPEIGQLWTQVLRLSQSHHVRQANTRTAEAWANAMVRWENAVAERLGLPRPS